MMQYRRIGRTDIELSVVGLGTAQLQNLSRRQAVKTLARGFELGVNWVHSAPDYGEAEPWIAEAIAASGRDVAVLATAPGPLSLVEPNFEHISRLFGKRRLEMYGLGCIDDLERAGENVWGAGGMIDLLRRKKAEGRLQAIFCTTHGTPDYIERLVRSGMFDAVIVAWNPIGFHLLTYDPPAEEHREFERLPDTRARVFPLAAAHGVSLIVMKALGGGLLAYGRAFPPHEWFAAPAAPLRAGDLLRYALGEPGVCAVVAGVASPEEAEENARAGHAPLELTAERRVLVDRAVARMRLRLCSRCGECEPTCSRSLPISFMFRDAYIWNYRTETFMGDDRFNYLRLHPGDELACLECVNRTCACPQGLDIPAELSRIHSRVRALVGARQHPGRIEERRAAVTTGAHEVVVLTREVPGRLAAGATGVARFLVQNAGSAKWPAGPYRYVAVALSTGAPARMRDRLRRLARASARRVLGARVTAATSLLRGRKSHAPAGDGAMSVGALAGDRLVGGAPLRQGIAPGQRSFVVVEFQAPGRAGEVDLRFVLMQPGATANGTDATVFDSSTLTVDALDRGPRHRRLARAGRRLARRYVGRLRAARARAASGSTVGPPYAAGYLDHTIPSRLRAGTTSGLQVTIENRGSSTWRAQSSDGDMVDVRVFVDEALYSVLALPRADVPPGARVTVHFAFGAPLLEGRHSIRIDACHARLGYFSDLGSSPLVVEIDVERSMLTRSARLAAVAARRNPWYYNPTQSIQDSRDGRSYPGFIERAKGCRVWDPEGREYIDYTMSWGATILGHADERVQSAVRSMLESGPLPPFPHPVEMEVAQMLADDFPSAEMVVFGKNGSDVCTVAARLARLATRKRVILSCGFHGWQDFALDMFAFEDSGIPKGPDRVLFKFRFGDRQDFFRLYEEHKSDLAAVMIEPSGPFGEPEIGIEPDADPEFLHAIAGAARRAGALLIFDEIITGYRYRQGSVQKATGVIPDLTCLGKALASGLPLAALVGRSRIFHAPFWKTHYCPTFKGDVYALAAAKAAIGIYRNEPVAEHIWAHGERLRAGIDAICRDLGVAARCQGPPFRMGLHFLDADRDIARFKRTIYMQELLKEGVITVTGVMLPSYAHDDVVLQRTLDAVGAALEVVAAAARSGDFHRYLEIPPI